MSTESKEMTLTRREYEDLVDARDHAIAMREVAFGAPVLTDAELDDYLAAPTPLAFWRRRTGKTQAVVAASVGISQAFLAQMEAGARVGGFGTYIKLAKTLGVRTDDLAPENESADA